MNNGSDLALQGSRSKRQPDLELSYDFHGPKDLRKQPRPCTARDHGPRDIKEWPRPYTVWDHGSQDEKIGRDLAYAGDQAPGR